MASTSNPHSAAPWTFITVTYNSAEQLRRSWTNVDLGPHEWIVVDNASSDDSADLAESLGARVVRRSGNHGFSSSNNVGLAEVDTDWVMFVNPDLTPDIGSMARLQGLAHDQSALVAPQLVNLDGTLQPNARGFPTIPQKLANRGVFASRIDTAKYARTNLNEPTYIAWAMGAAIGGPAELFHDLGGWDSRYFIYYEDHDIGLRSWLTGHPVILDPHSRWIHAWQRETAGFNLTPWKHELRSARIFYGTYPELLRRRSSYERGRFTDLASRLWQPVAAQRKRRIDG